MVVVTLPFSGKENAGLIAYLLNAFWSREENILLSMRDNFVCVLR